MYMHYCKRCQRVHMLNGHKQFCPRCQGTITELKLSYLDYASMDESQRVSFTVCCADDEQLRKLSTTYRMYKYSKWYKELQRQRSRRSILTPHRNRARWKTPYPSCDTKTEKKSADRSLRIPGSALFL